jgi:hypothetical protein
MVGTPPISFSQRSPSAGWEPLPLDGERQLVVWGWFKPQPAPNSVIIQLPSVLWQNPGMIPWLTVGRLAAAAGMDSLSGWTYSGQFIPLDEQSRPLLNALLPPPVSTDPQLILWSLMIAPPSVPATFPAASSGAGDLLPGESPNSFLDLIDFYWMSVLYLEADIERARAQLESSMSKLNSLDRDLNLEEAQAADSADKKDWVDARRWLRNSAQLLSRSIKEIHTGALSAAGQRNRFETIYQQYVKARLPFPGIKQAAVDFEMYYKTARNVLQVAQAAVAKGTAEAERRASAVLQRIAGKASKNRFNSRTKHK